MEPALAELGLHCPDTQTCFALLLGQVPSAPTQREVCPAGICLCSLGSHSSSLPPGQHPASSAKNLQSLPWLLERQRLCPCYSRRSVHVAVQGAVTALSAMPSPPKLLCPEGQTWCQTLSWHSANCSCSAAHLGCCGTMLWERGCSSGPGLRATLDLSLHPLELCPGWSGGSETLWGLFIWMQPVS